MLQCSGYACTYIDYNIFLKIKQIRVWLQENLKKCSSSSKLTWECLDCACVVITQAVFL